MFVALDVETANSRWGSICQIGLALFDETLGPDAGPVNEWQSLIDPMAPFDRGNIAVHGIRPGDVDGAPTFAQAAADIFSRMEGMVVVAHNCSFDRNCVTYAAADAGIAAAPATWLCSLQVARRAWHGEIPRFGLKHVAAHLDLSFRHHDALEDARIAGRILTAAIAKTDLGVDDWLTRVKQPVAAPHRRNDLPRPLAGQISARALGGR